MSLGVGVNASAALVAVNSVATSGIATQATGSAFYVVVGWHSGATKNTPTDNKGNVYVQFGVDIGDATFQYARYICANGVGGAGHTFTFTTGGSAALCQILAQEITTSNLAGVTTDKTDGNVIPASPWTSPFVATTVAAEILMGGFLGHTGSGTAVFAGAQGFTVTAQITDGATDNAACIGYKLVSSTGSYQSEFTQTGLNLGGNSQNIIIDTFSEVITANPYTNYYNGRIKRTHDAIRKKRRGRR